jgi:hypothetical protein
MEAVDTSEASVYFYETTRRNIPEGCHIHIRRREKLKSHYLPTIRFINCGLYTSLKRDKYITESEGQRKKKQPVLFKPTGLYQHLTGLTEGNQEITHDI